LFELGWANERFGLVAAPADGGPAGGAPSWQPVQFIGAGGGKSPVYAQPTWQKGIVPPELSTTATGQARVLPDVAMVADPHTGFTIGETDPDPKSPTYQQYHEIQLGGTSLACPLFAGVIALAEQRAKQQIGFSAPLLYKISRVPAFRDIVPASSPMAVGFKNDAGNDRVATLDFQGQTIKTAPGFDTITGLGVPNGVLFLDTITLEVWLQNPSFHAQKPEVKISKDVIRKPVDKKTDANKAAARSIGLCGLHHAGARATNS
jgi:hypothetical protein